MIRHLFTLIWNRKRSNFLLIGEIVLSFFVLFVISSLLLYNYMNYRQPMGFEYQNVWEMQLTPGQDSTDRNAVVEQLMQRLRATPGVVEVSRTRNNSPFSFSTHNTHLWYKKQQSPVSEHYDADDEFENVLQMAVTEGRWFDRRDNAATHTPIIVNRRFANEVFGDESAVGKVLADREGADKYKVVGVIENYRSGNDFAANDPSFFVRNTLADTIHPSEQPLLLIRVQPGSGAVLEQQLVKEVKAVTKGWSTNVETLNKLRQNKLKFVLTPLYALGLVCVFLIINVALGLFGVLWYNISQRRAEIGLRRAFGATGQGIGAQFLGEMLVVTTLGVLVGSLLAAQFPLLGVLDVAPAVYLSGMALATALIFTLTAVCAFQPSRMAAAIQPAVSLREE
ncbi:ABC transporter permease [Hymenobacter koreensis]|uniref:ABC transporter permease n=1 Tax=Hymenobacter koreensis TaxID=1084523 RepID=A0ABP8JMI4_9BACT